MSGPHDPSRPDLYTRVTARIVEDLQRGVRPWTKPWSVERLADRICRPLRYNLEPYNGVNVILLWSEALDRSYPSPIWMTFRQAGELGAHVRKGEHGATVVYANRITRSVTTDAGEDVERSIPFLKAYSVFNVAQIDGLPQRYQETPAVPLEPAAKIAAAETFFGATGADIRHGGTQAYYAIGPDHVQLPPFESFQDVEAYYATLAHECTHSTRLDRDLGRQRWGDEGYAKEELVAELGAAFLCADLGLELQPREDHAAYIGHWLDVLDRDHRLIFTAAAHAQRAVDYLHGRQPSAGVRAA
jgi:antirestriction protein ArdC